MGKLRSAFLALGVLASGCVVHSSAGAPPVPMPDLSPAPAGTLTAGIAAGAAASQVQAQAFADWVKDATGHATRPALFPDYDALAAAIAKGQVDVALMSPLAFVRAEGQGKVTPLLRTVRNGQGTYRSVLFTRAGAKVKSLDDLKKAGPVSVAWVDSSSATGYIFPKAMLLANKIDPAGAFSKQDFLGSHDAVCHAVADGKADLGATFSDDPAAQPATHANGCDAALGADAAKLQIVAATANIPNDVLAVKGDLDADAVGKLQNGANQLASSDAGKAQLKSVFQAEGMAPVTSADLQPVRDALESFHEHVQ